MGALGSRCRLVASRPVYQLCPSRRTDHDAAVVASIVNWAIVFDMDLSGYLVEQALQTNSGALQVLATGGGMSAVCVHELRVTAKRLTALWLACRALVNPNEFSARLDGLRVVRRMLAGARDRDVLLGCFTDLARGAEGDDKAHRALEQMIAWCEEIPVEPLPVDSLSVLLQQDAAGWRAIPEAGVDAVDRVIDPGMRKVYRKARRLGERALSGLRAEELHRWRRWVKYALYEVEALAPRLSEPAAARLWYLEKLANVLGEYQDLAMAAGRLDQVHVGGGRKAAGRLIVGRQDALVPRMEKLFPRAFGPKPRAFAAWLRDEIEMEGSKEERCER